MSQPEKRSTEIQIRVSPTEKEIITAAAAAQGVTPAALVRESALKAAK